MAKYRKRPVVIEAIQWMPDANGVNTNPIPLEWGNGPRVADDGGQTLIIRTLEGDMRAEPGDWIIRGVKGEFYPCKPDIFAATYESAE
jgi:hypothetical protein